MISKQAAGYVHKQATEYSCADCILYLDRIKRCQILGSEDVLLYDTCNDWVPGTPSQLGDQPLFAFIKTQVGFARSNYGFGCKRCKYFNVEANDCSEVDKDSIGDDPGLIHPMACCNVQQPDEVRGNLPSEAVNAMVRVPSAIFMGVFSS